MSGYASRFGSVGGGFDPANPGAIGGTTPNTGAFTRLSVAQGTLTDPVTGINLTATWNDAAHTFTGIFANITDTASNGNSFLLHFQVGGANRVRVFKDGRASFEGNVTAPIIVGTSFLSCLSDVGGVLFGAANDARLIRAAAATLQMGANHASTPTAQRIQAHGVTTGTGANLTLSGGAGSVAYGGVLIDLNSIPTSDPSTPGRIWRDGTDLKISI
jgi:hypothetical protein